MFFSRTDLPVPEGPRMAVIRPLGTSKVMSSSTVWEPKDLVTPRSEMIGSPGAIHSRGRSGSSRRTPVMVGPFPLSAPSTSWERVPVAVLTGGGRRRPAPGRRRHPRFRAGPPGRP